MPRRGLSSRLQHLRSAREQRFTPSVEYEAQAALIPGFMRTGSYLYESSRLHSDITPPEAGSGLLLPGGIDVRNLLFFDLETTGLSSGAGTVAFLAGFGRYTVEGFRIDQYFLSDYPGEFEFLKRIDDLITPDQLLVSYNGRAYDAHLLTSRGLMNGIRFSLPRHLDLLYLSRRLWRRQIGSCSLSNIEQRVLGLDREEDLPGMEVPGRWFSFLKTWDAKWLREVFSHHHQDILSLALLYERVEEILSAAEVFSGYDRRALGLFLLSRGIQGRGEAELLSAYNEGDDEAGIYLALTRKRSGDWKRAVEIWLQLAEQDEHPTVMEELAKYYEHQQRDLVSALYWARAGLLLLEKRGASPRRCGDFLHRIERLQRKDAGAPD